MNKKIRIALITNDKKCFSWQYSIISELLNSDFSEIILNINNSSPQKKNLPFFWKQYLKIDNKLFKPNPNGLSQESLGKLLGGIPVLKIGKNFDYQSLSKHNIDIIINLKEIVSHSKLANFSKYGLWFFNHCDLNKINKRPYALWEILNNESQCVSVLRLIKNDNEPIQTIDITSSCIENMSYKRNLNSLSWQASNMIYNNIGLLHKNEALFNNKIFSNNNVYSSNNLNPEFQLPSNLKLARFIFNLIFKKIKHTIRSKFYFHQWALTFLNTKKNSDVFSFKDYTKILPPKDRFWADPFLIKNNNKYYLFIEELVYKDKLGHLSVMEIDENGNYTKPEIILKKDYHLSYPFVFKENDQYYMIPETSENNDIQLYKCTEFPLKWELEKVLIRDVVAVDTTIYKAEDTFWMFTNIKKQEGGSKHVELLLFSSNKLITNNWTPHPLNPIVSDIKKSRPAGALFRLNNQLLRPSQNCSKYYGRGLNFTEITELNKTNFKEVLLQNIIPDWEKNISNIHSFNLVDHLAISDIKIKRNKYF